LDLASEQEFVFVLVKSYCNRYHIGNIRRSQSFCLVGGRGIYGENALASGHASAMVLL
jgi:hypothetical protein